MPNEPGGWTFMDFVDQHGENQIHRWLHEQSPEVRAYYNALIGKLSVLTGVFARANSVGLLRKPPCKNEQMIELLGKFKNVQYRPIGWYGPARREVTLLVGAKERGGKFEPRDAERTAINRKRLVMMSRKHVIKHDYS